MMRRQCLMADHLVQLHTNNDALFIATAAKDHAISGVQQDERSRKEIHRKDGLGRQSERPAIGVLGRSLNRIELRPSFQDRLKRPPILSLTSKIQHGEVIVPAISKIDALATVGYLQS